MHARNQFAKQAGARRHTGVGEQGTRVVFFENAAHRRAESFGLHRITIQHLQ